MFKIISNKRIKRQEETVLRMVQTMTTQRRKIKDLQKEVNFLISKLDEAKNKKVKKTKRSKK